MLTLKKSNKGRMSRQVFLIVGTCLLLLSGCKQQEETMLPQAENHPQEEVVEEVKD